MAVTCCMDSPAEWSCPKFSDFTSGALVNIWDPPLPGGIGIGVGGGIVRLGCGV